MIHCTLVRSASQHSKYYLNTISFLGIVSLIEIWKRKIITSEARIIHCLCQYLPKETINYQEELYECIWREFRICLLNATATVNPMEVNLFQPLAGRLENSAFSFIYFPHLHCQPPIILRQRHKHKASMMECAKCTKPAIRACDPCQGAPTFAGEAVAPRYCSVAW